MGSAKHGIKNEASEREARFVSAIAPRRPPCFDSHEAWTVWLIAAHRAEENPCKPLVLVKQKGGGGARTAEFNLGLSFCADCTPKYRAEMQEQGRCDPTHLLDMRDETVVAG